MQLIIFKSVHILTEGNCFNALRCISTCAVDDKLRFLVDSTAKEKADGCNFRSSIRPVASHQAPKDP